MLGSVLRQTGIPVLHISKSSFFNQLRFSRFRRGDFKNRLKKLKTELKEKRETGPYYNSEYHGLRPTRHLWKALGFTVGVGAVSFGAAAVVAYEKGQRRLKMIWDTVDSIYAHTVNPMFREQWFSHINDGYRSALFLIALNTAVFIAWRVRYMDHFMWTWFTNSFASRALCMPMVLSAFSHSNFVHLCVNMYVLHSFIGVTVDRFMGIYQFGAFYLTAAAVSSLTSLSHKCFMGSKIRALGASGAILAMLIYTCIRIPDARLSIVFFPYFDFSAQTAAIAIILFDLAGIVFRFQLFDHAAHLGGSIFGL